MIGGVETWLTEACRCEVHTWCYLFHYTLFPALFSALPTTTYAPTTTEGCEETTDFLPFAPPCDAEILDINDARVNVVASSSTYHHQPRYAFDNGSYTNEKYWKPKEDDFEPLLTISFNVDIDVRVTMVSVEANHVDTLYIRIGDNDFPPVEGQELDTWSELILPIPISNKYKINKDTPITLMFVPLGGRPCVKNLVIEVCGNFTEIATTTTGSSMQIPRPTSPPVTTTPVYQSTLAGEY
ncbi:hypothetical protein ScPMuIL_016251 [Solemya velum]